MEKIEWGFSMILLIVLLLLLPLMLFSSDSSALVSNPVKSMSMEVNLLVRAAMKVDAQIAGEPLNVYSFQNSGTVEQVSKEEYYTWQSMFRDTTGKAILLPKWVTESQKINIPSIVRASRLSPM